MKRFFCFIVYTVVPFIAIAKKNEIGIYIKDGLLLNQHEVTVLTPSSGKPITNVKNTLQQGIGINYLYYTKCGLILSGGVEAGYEKYSVSMQIPFASLGYQHPSSDDNYIIKRTIPYAEINLNLGYKLPVGRLKPEIRLGQALHMPLKAYDLYKVPYAFDANGNNNPIYYRYGAFGNAGRVPIGELLNNIYIGINALKNVGFIKTVKIGVQFQKKFILAESRTNYLKVEYYKSTSEIVSTEEFLGRHASINLLIGAYF